MSAAIWLEHYCGLHLTFSLGQTTLFADAWSSLIMRLWKSSQVATRFAFSFWISCVKSGGVGLGLDLGAEEAAGYLFKLAKTTNGRRGGGGEICNRGGKEEDGDHPLVLTKAFNCSRQRRWNKRQVHWSLLTTTHWPGIPRNPIILLHQAFARELG